MNDPIKTLDVTIADLTRVRNQLATQTRGEVNIPVNQALKDHPSKTREWPQMTEQYWQLLVRYQLTDSDSPGGIKVKVIEDTDLNRLLDKIDTLRDNLKELSAQVISISIDPHYRLTDKNTGSE